ncbi:endonuclease domain-containing protein [Persicimonas caeni]|uniref:Endonuclease domain-containing protein n=1 Tax=Persicimonas caeni TaxID=2292766 RepID=A0A4Y6PSQ5_PERCE|nr:endonuclease domain-containing protein [Persicimonas caeni]QDG51338.1 endonuclease domain-containing protein [Persicimonas caeni]QED32559.1 endonuclease domain-containing protein [Persicimonas caeni]
MQINKAHKKELLKRARTMRSNPTDAERLLWNRLRNKQLGGHKFRRQNVMAPYIVDFYCAAKKLVVEVDGDVHDEEGQQAKDETRDEFLEREYGVEVVRFGMCQDSCRV